MVGLFSLSCSAITYKIEETHLICGKDYMDLENAKSRRSSRKDSWKTTLLLAYQSLGVVYGDLSISPLYVYKSTFADDIHHSNTNEEIFGVLSFVFWTLTLVPLFKYVFIVLRADDNGEGGTFALYSLICRHANVGLLPNRQLADQALSTYVMEHPTERKSSLRVRVFLERHKPLHTALLILVLLGTCMVIGDGLLTPTISVFSAVSGLELSMEHHQYAVIPITCFILVCLFALQHYGTHRVGFFFAPIILVWLLSLSGLGLYNIFHWNRHIYKALSPYYMLKFLKKTKKGGWMSLGGILLCITEMPRIPKGWGAKPKKAEVPKKQIDPPPAVTKKISPEKIQSSNRAPPYQDAPLPKKQKSTEDAPSSTLVASVIGELAHPLITDDDLTFWSSLKEDESDNALIRSAGETYFHVMNRARAWSKDKARLKMLERDEEIRQTELTAAIQAKARLETSLAIVKGQLSKAESDLALSHSEVEKNKKDKAEMARLIDGFHLEKKEWAEGVKAAKEEGRELGFHDFLRGFLAFEPNFDWSRWGPSTKEFMAEFKAEEADAIAAKKIELEEEAKAQLDDASTSARLNEESTLINNAHALNVSPLNSFVPPPPE